MAKSEGLGSLFGEQPKEEQTNLPALLFKARNDAHITHLLNRDGTLATHKALQKFYEELIDLIDGFIETSLILYPVADICVEESCCIADPKAYFKDLYRTVEGLRVKYKESFLQNQIDEVQTLISQTIYRLSYIRT